MKRERALQVVLVLVGAGSKSGTRDAHGPQPRPEAGIGRSWRGGACCARSDAAARHAAIPGYANRSADVYRRAASICYRCPGCMLRSCVAGNARGPAGGAAI